jgi:hypothetical protein
VLVIVIVLGLGLGPQVRLLGFWWPPWIDNNDDNDNENDREEATMISAFFLGERGARERHRTEETEGVGVMSSGAM